MSGDKELCGNMLLLKPSIQVLDTPDMIVVFIFKGFHA